MLFDPFFEKLSVLTGGMPTDHLKLVFSILLTYAYAVIFNHLPNNPTLKHIFSIVITTVTFVWFHAQLAGFLHLFFISLFTYAAMYWRRDSWAARIVFVVCMAHMSYSHLVRQLSGYAGDANYDHTGPQMVLAIKLTSFAYNVWDGTRPDNVLTPYNISKRVKSFPSLLEFFGWAFFFGGFLTGPAIEYMDYKNFVEMKVFEVDDKLGNKRIQKPDGIQPGLRKLSMSIAYIVYHTVIGTHYDMETLLSKSFLGSSLFFRFWYIQFSGFNTRVKYYIVWTMAEGACIVCGIGFNGYDAKGRALWNRVSNIDVHGYETAQNCKELLESWNMRTNVWLRNYVYLRVTPPDKKPGFLSTLATFGTSALWHGFHPGYYLTFVTGALTQQAAKTVRRVLRPFFLTPDLKHPLPQKKAYDFVSWFVTQVTFNYVVIPFGILTLSGSYTVWRSLLFYAHVGILTMELLNMAGLGNYLRKLQKERAEKEGLKVKELKPSDKVVVNGLGLPDVATAGGIQVGRVKAE